MPTVLHDIALRAIQVHGALGVSNEMPFSRMLIGASVMGLADGPTEVHKVTVARQLLRDHRPSDDIWTTEHLPKRKAAARAKYAAPLALEVGNLGASSTPPCRRSTPISSAAWARGWTRSGSPAQGPLSRESGRAHV